MFNGFCLVFLQELGHEVRDGDLPEDEAARIAVAKMNENQSHGKGWYRINATRMLTGGRKLVPRVLNNFQEVRFCHVLCWTLYSFL